MKEPGMLKFLVGLILAPFATVGALFLIFFFSLFVLVVF